MIARATRGATGACALALVLGLGGCLVQPSDGEQTVTIGLSLRAPGPALQQGGTPPQLWDATGLFDLGRFPKLVRAAVWFEDYELAATTWPHPKTGLGSGEGPSGEVSLSLVVPAGANRRLRVLGYYHDAAARRVLVYSEAGTYRLDVGAGKTTELAVNTTLHRSGNLDLTVRCQSGDAGPFQPYAVALVDARALVLHPSRTLQSEAGALKLAVRGLPADRPHWARVFVQTPLGQAKTLDVRKPTFSVPAGSSTQAVNLVIPCNPGAAGDGGPTDATPGDSAPEDSATGDR